MRNKVFTLDNFADNLYSYKKYHKDTNGNVSDIEKMKIFLNKAITTELTPRQKLCVTSYFLENKKMKDIALDLHISKSAVSRHIKRGITVLQKRSIYFD